ncbi:MAG: UDP-4-amino-4,6-dideoxy-N-acetyl-beta-L-altrosamine transaminase [Candidatus Nanopelagicales bacterium]|nr:UDP-4-amino-4,6-dideoxy-N-acetyl-beta-L-altrosamine transaminase [Candidatus Nanopelagicales bacterium]MDZ4248940.1 UDP-4-amino-4,6-dideoxy-N-acetyl-beta-L-altrosamine transaminase [Candidatus Nanopelagicales bacterium]
MGRRTPRGLSSTQWGNQAEVIPYGRQSVDEEDVAAVSSVLRSAWLTTGPAVEEFESELARQVGAAQCVSVTSGTAALHCAYTAGAIGPGDEVITPPLTFVATQAAAAALGAKIKFADVEPDTGNIDPAAAAALVTPQTRAIVAVDYAGHPAELDDLRSIAREHGILLIEDAAHSIGSCYRGRPVGSIADLTTFSFFPTKNITTGEGGAVATADPTLAQRARLFRNHGLVRDSKAQRYPDEGPWHQEVHDFGLNYRLPDILAALGLSQLDRMAEFKRRRAEIFGLYAALLGGIDDLALPTVRDHVDPMWHLFPLRVPASERARIFQSLRKRGIGVQVNYMPAYWHPVFEDLGYKRGTCPNAEAYYREEISLPMFPGLRDDEVHRVADAVVSSLGRPGAS